MKTRRGFVSNSSSSSFIIKNRKAKKIRAYIKKLIDADNELNNNNLDIDNICTIIELNDVNIHSYSYYNWCNYRNEISFEEYKKLKSIRKEEPGVLIESKNDNSIPWPIQEALQHIGQRFHWG
jgi:hypothetical protein